MASPSPPKPWERAGAAGATSISSIPGVSAAPGNVPSVPTSTATATTTSSDAPALPARPDALNQIVNRTASNYSTMNANRYGSSPYGYGGGYNSYSSPYNRLGGGYGSMYGGVGGYGMGGMYGGMNGMNPGMYGGGMGGMPGDPNNQSLTQSYQQSTQATFQMIESIVGAFGGFAQMLESTYMATHSSFFAMVSVAEQFGTLKETLGSVLGIFTVMRWIRNGIAKLTGRPPPASSKDLTPSNFAAFNGRQPDGSPVAPRPSRKPFIFFIIAVFGLPYLMSKLIKALARSQEEEQKRIEANPQAFSEGQPLDPNKLEFCRVKFDFTSETNPNVQPGVDLAVKKGDFVAVLSKTDPMGNPSEWWRCRARNGQMGYLPGVYLETIQRKQQTAQITTGSQSGSPAGSRAQTMTASTAGSRSATMTSAKPVQGPETAPSVSGKAGDMGIESFQKGQFYS